MEEQIKCFPDKVKLKEFKSNHYYMKWSRDLCKKRKNIKPMNIKKAKNSQLSTTEYKKTN